MKVELTDKLPEPGGPKGWAIFNINESLARDKSFWQLANRKMTRREASEAYEAARIEIDLTKYGVDFEGSFNVIIGSVFTVAPKKHAVELADKLTYHPATSHLLW